MPKIKLFQKPPVCPGCRKTISKIDIVIMDIEVQGENGKMISVCCANTNCGMLLTADVHGEEEVNKTKSKLVSLN